MSNTVSSKYQIVIPRAVRKQLGIVPGQKMRVTATRNGSVLLQKDESDSIDAIIAKHAGSARGVWRQEGLTADVWLARERSAWDK